ncbi:hypothetical protein HCC61_26585 [Streptomyces sp. HNM0575]|uniref:hypothetical protein n=1 Tax=Streptomyces sp. HNM0575 TaxID=2716338 RepID=UPI00145D9036|nr:hypothetical protein [Streptomyces sp. HNM0575]NLU76167.1 hypothetical protein [Streptomyces sp. HNM0575]
MTRHAAALGRYEVRLLLWLLEQCGDRAQVPVPTGDFALRQNKPALGVAAVVEALQERGLVQAHEEGELPPPDAELTSEGLARAHELAGERGDLAALQRYTEDALLDWAHEQERTGHRPRLKEFFVSEQVFFHGSPLSQSEVEGSARFLCQAGLLTVSGGTVADRVSLTPAGRRCAAEGCGVSEHLTREPAPASIHVEHVEGDFNVTYGNVVRFVDTIREHAPGLDLDAERLDRLMRDTEELRRTGALPQQRGTQRTLTARICEQLSAAPNSAAAQALLHTIGPVLTRLLG